MTQEKINIAELLKDCPKGMELDCTIYDNVEFEGISDNKDWPIAISVEGYPEVLNPYGCISYRDYTKCVIFPKGKTTWEGFVPPCQFKDGDIIFTHANCLKVGVGNTWISIFKERRNGGVATYVDYTEDGSDYYSDLDGDKALLCMESDILRQRFATEEEKEKLFKAIEDNGYKWNSETKTLEKLIELKFKVGDRIKSNVSDKYYIIKDIEFDRYILTNDCFLRFNGEHDFELVVEPKFKVGDVIVNNYRKHLNGDSRSWKIYQITKDKYIFTDGSFMYIQDQNNWVLNTTKFDITTLVPYESRVLARYCKDSKWIPTFWGSYDNEDLEYPYNCCGMLFAQCIPYEGNEYLLNTADDCDEYFKTWK